MTMYDDVSLCPCAVCSRIRAEAPVELYAVRMAMSRKNAQPPSPDSANREGE
jgi:hypothetical protein